MPSCTKKSRFRFILLGIIVVLMVGSPQQELHADDRVPYFVREWGPEGSGIGQLAFPWGITHDQNGDLVIADTRNRRIQIYDIDGNFLRGWPLAETPTTLDVVSSDVAVAANGDIYVVDPGTTHVQRYTSTGAFLGSWGQEGTEPQEFLSPAAIALDSEGNVYITDPSNAAIKIFTSTGDFITSWENGVGGAIFEQPIGITIGHDGYAYVTDIALSTESVQKFTLDGQLVTRWGGFGTLLEQFKTPLATSMDVNGDVWVIDHHNFRIQKFTSDGVFLCAFGERGREDGQLVDPISMTILDEGDLFITDFANDGMVQHFRIPNGTAVESTSWSQVKRLFRAP